MLTLQTRSHYVIELSFWVFVSTTVTVLRLISQRLQRGSIKKYRADDWLMVFCLVLHIMDGVSGFYGILKMDLLGPLNTESADTAERKFQLAAHYFWAPAEVVFQLKLWCLKGCLLLLYSRLTIHNKLIYIVKAAAVYTVATFLILLFYFFGGLCHPFSDLWTQIDTETPGECQTWRIYYIMQFAFNISSDLMIMSIPLLLFLASTLPTKRKFVLCGLFSLGGLIMVCAIINKVYTLSNSLDLVYIFWSYRETNLAMMVTNLPLCWTLLRRTFGLKSFDERSQTIDVKDFREAARPRSI